MGSEMFYYINTLMFTSLKPFPFYRLPGHGPEQIKEEESFSNKSLGLKEAEGCRARHLQSQEPGSDKEIEL